MKHHFADLLDRDGNYWTIVPNINRFAYSIDEVILNKKDVKIITISRDDKYWKQVYELPYLEELTLHQPSKEQLEAVGNLPQIQRLRITHAKPNNIDFITNLINLKECVLEYVSGFSDLSPFNKLKKLKSLHFENLRGVNDFSGLSGIDSLKYLLIDGTLDWNQPIKDFIFLEGLQSLEVFALRFITNKTDFPAFLPILKLKKLKRIKIGRATLDTKEYAFLETALPNVTLGPSGGGSWELCWEYNEYYEFLGKRAGRVKCNNPKATEKCEEFIHKYEDMKKECKERINLVQGRLT